MRWSWVVRADGASPEGRRRLGEAAKVGDRADRLQMPQLKPHAQTVRPFG